MCGLRVWGLGLQVQGLWAKLGFGVEHAGLRVQGFGVGVSYSGLGAVHLKPD